MKLSSLCYSIILAISSLLVARVLADFELQGGGKCGDSNGSWSDSWKVEPYRDISLATCEENCKKTLLPGVRVGVSFVPGNFAFPSLCYTYAGKGTPAVKVTTTFLDSGAPGANCYRYVSDNTGKVWGVRYVTLLRY